MVMMFEEWLSEFKKVIEQVSFEFVCNLELVNDEIYVIDWQGIFNQYGVFKFNIFGQEVSQQEVYYQYLSVNENYFDIDIGVYIVGDLIFYIGGWVEGVVMIVFNVVVVIVVYLGGIVLENLLFSLDKNKYDYGVV